MYYQNILFISHCTENRGATDTWTIQTFDMERKCIILWWGMETMQKFDVILRPDCSGMAYREEECHTALKLAKVLLFILICSMPYLHSEIVRYFTEVIGYVMDADLYY